jgi:hypothetical protein
MPRIPGIDFSHQVGMEDILARQRAARRQKALQRRDLIASAVGESVGNALDYSGRQAAMTRADQRAIEVTDPWAASRLGQDQSQFSATLAARGRENESDRAFAREQATTQTQARTAATKQDFENELRKKLFEAQLGGAIESPGWTEMGPEQQNLLQNLYLQNAMGGAGDIDPATMAAQRRLGGPPSPAAPTTVGEEPAPLEPFLDRYRGTNFSQSGGPPPSVPLEARLGPSAGSFELEDLAPLLQGAWQGPREPWGAEVGRPQNPPPLDPSRAPYGGGLISPTGPPRMPSIQEKATQQRMLAPPPPVPPAPGIPENLMLRPRPAVPGALGTAGTETSSIGPSMGDIRQQVLVALMGGQEDGGVQIPGIPAPGVTKGKNAIDAEAEARRRAERERRKKAAVDAAFGAGGGGRSGSGYFG